MIKKKIISIFLVLSLILSFVSVAAQDDVETSEAETNEEETSEEEMDSFSEQDMFDWLKSQTTDGSFDEGKISSTAWAMMAFSKANLNTEAENSFSWLESNKNENNCWPQNTCNNIDTALAAIAYKEATKDVSKLEDYFNSALSGFTEGNWNLQITTPETGVCTLSYTINENFEEQEITVEEGTFPDCGGNKFFDLNSCLKTNLLKNYPNLDINVDCSQLESTPFITLIYKQGNIFYIVSSYEGNVADIKVPNGCFGRGSGDNCNVDATMYVAWALDEIGSEIDTSVFLRENYDESNGLHNVILYFISRDLKYLEQLKSLQSSNGAIDRNILNTALAIKAWEDSPTAYSSEIETATTYLQSRQREDGSLNSDVVSTAAAIYGAFGYGVTSSATCFDGIQNQNEEDIDCGGVCEELYGYVCESDEPDQEETETTADPCNYDEVCDVNFEENRDNCPSDCYCGDGKCDSTENADNCPEDCDPNYGLDTDTDTTDSQDEPVYDDTEEEGGAFGTILIIILLLLVLGGGGFFAYQKGWIKLPGGNKGGYGQNNTGSQKQKYQPFSSKLPPMPQKRAPQFRKPINQNSKSDSSSALGRSLEEAKKLLKK